ncbi:MAG TPA: HAD-IB family hydrolase [Jiangellales bacterium]|nr:HAD-IB family hydrolase [Jiangellales bacterium]
MARLSPRALRRRGVEAGEAAAAAAKVEGPEEVAGEPDPRAAAFFDVDNTVLRGASIFYLARGLYARKFFGTRAIARFAYQQVRFRLGAEDLEHVDEVRSAALAFIAGHSVAELTQISEEVFDEFISDKIWPGTRAIAQMHLDQGQRVWLVTATPVEVATIIATRMGLTGALGTVAEHEDGIYTGRLVGDLLHGPAKAEAVRALAAREGLDLERCSAYSDSANDIPMLSLVGNPCAINPDARLRAHAREQGWRIRDYRGKRKTIAVSTAAGAGAVGGAVAAGLAVRRSRR